MRYSQVENFGSTTHAQPNANPNASYYDIRECFQGRNNNKGKMNAKSSDESYNQLLSTLKEAMEMLRLQIVPKVYAYKFLMWREILLGDEQTTCNAGLWGRFLWIQKRVTMHKVTP